MAVTVTGKNYTSISTCEATTGWTGNSAALDTALVKEGNNSLSFILRTAGNNDVYYAGGPWNLNNKHVRLWWLFTASGLMQTLASNGLQFFLYDGTNTAYYTVLGRDTYPGGWFNLVLDCNRTPTSGSVNLSNVTRIGFRLVLTGAPKNAANTWIDNLILCDGLIASGDLAGSYFSFEDIYAADNATTGGWGVIRKIGGVYFLTGSIEIGAAIATKFQAKSQTVVFEDRPVSSTLYQINVVDDANAAHTTEFILGSKSGTAGIEGCNIRVQSSSQACKFNVDGATDTDVDNFKLYGTTFVGANTISMPPTGTNVESLNCNFEGCGEVLPNTSLVQYCNFVSPTNRGVRISSTSHQVKNCNFISCPKGANFSVANSSPGYNWIGNIHTNNTYDVENSSAGAVLINLSSGSNASTYTNTGGGSTSFSNPLSINITVKDENNGNVNQAFVYVDENNAEPYIMNTQTGTDGIATGSYNGGAVTATLRVRKYGYKQYKGSLYLNANINQTVVLIADPQQT